MYSIVLSQIRIPRTLTAMAAGAALGLSGLLLQSVMRNLLSCPTLIGVSNGSALSALALLLWIPAISLNLYFLVTFCGGMAAFALIYLFSFARRFSTSRMILAGTTFNALFYGFSYLLIVAFPERAQNLLFVLNGSIAAAKPMASYYLVAITLTALLLIWLYRYKLDMLGASADTLKSLGISSHSLSMLFLTLAILLSSSVAAVIGPVAFFGLVVPNLVRILAGKRASQRIFFCALLGALLMLLTDVLIRRCFGGAEVSIGIIFAFVSIPFLVILLRMVRL